jgi:hypothetical protein
MESQEGLLLFSQREEPDSLGSKALRGVFHLDNISVSRIRPFLNVR